MKKNILIYPSGSENAIEIYYAIRNSVHLNVVAATGKTDVSSLIYDSEVHTLPYIQDENFILEINKLIRKESIDFIFPTHDTVALALAKNDEAIDAKIIGSPLLTNQVARFKSRTYEIFRDCSFCPTLIHGQKEINFPIFSKPDIGQGSKGAKIIQTKEEYELLKDHKELLFLEYLPGKEFTVDCFTTKDGTLKFVGARERVEVRMGISFRSQEVSEISEISKIAKEINSRLIFRGLWFFQVKEDQNGKLKLLEISTRAAGTVGFFRHKGVNLPLLSIFDAMDLPVEVEDSNFQVELFRVTTNKYKFKFDFDTVYLDFDDTLIVNGKVQISVISLIYQCKNKGKKIILLTKHEHDILETLGMYCIDPNLFDQIEVLPMHEKKSSYILTKKSIFIDNWYKERQEVYTEHGIPVFDVDAVQSLLKV